MSQVPRFYQPSRADAVGIAHAANEALSAHLEAQSTVDRLRGELNAAELLAGAKAAHSTEIRSLAETAVEAAFGSERTNENNMNPTAAYSLATRLFGPKNKSNRISEEGLRHIDAVADSMAEKFGLDREDVGLVFVRRRDSSVTRPVVMHIGDSGIYKGSFKQIWDPSTQTDYIITVDGKDYDTRLGMTKSSYHAFWCMGKPDELPDREVQGFNRRIDAVLKDGNGHPKTLLTGYSIQPGEEVPYAYSGQSWKQPYVERHPQDYDDKNLRFRPAVLIS